MNVYEAANTRIKYLFQNFDNIYISFSGGKDSGVLLNLFIDYMRKNKVQQRISVYHMDYEGQYQHTQDYLEQMMTGNEDIMDVYWVCLPLKTKCGVSMYDNYWLPWEPEKKDIWVRDLPKFKGVYTLDNHPFDFYQYAMQDTDFDLQFTGWIHRHNKAKRTIGLLGLRTEESLHRWRAMHKEKRLYDNRRWITFQEIENTFMGYPIYDWRVHDIWVGNYHYNWNYNKLYDLYYKAGLSIHQMRVASAFIDEGVINLNLHRVIDPDGWSKLVGRVNGANFGAIYGGTKANGYHKISLPAGHTWKTYCEFLLNTLPAETKECYIRKFDNSYKVWLQRGAAVYPEIADQLEKMDIGLKRLGKPKSKIVYNGEREMIRFKDYPDDIKHKHFKDLPSYKRMCITILKNDIACKYMGYAQTKYERELRQRAIEKYKNIL